MFLSTSRYNVLFQGEFDEGKVTVNLDLDAKPRFTRRQREEIDRHWNDMLRKGWKMRRDPLYRLINFSVRNDMLALHLGLTDYKEYMGTNVNHPEWSLEYGEKTMSNALSVSAVTETQDEKIIIERRSQNVGEDRGYYHTKPSGHPHPPEGIFGGICSQAKKELGIEESDIAKIACTGLVRSVRSHKPELTFKMTLGISSTEIERRPKEEAWEFDELLYLPKDPVFLARWLVKNFEKTVSLGHGTLLIYGFQNFGIEWLEKVKKELNFINESKAMI